MAEKAPSVVSAETTGVVVPAAQKSIVALAALLCVVIVPVTATSVTLICSILPASIALSRTSLPTITVYSPAVGKSFGM